MQFQRKLQCAVLHGATGGKEHISWFNINDYPSYKEAFKMANEQASEFQNGDLVVFDSRSVSVPMINAIENDLSGSSRMTELLYLQNVHSLLTALEKETEGFINNFDHILTDMIDETQLRIDSIRFEK